ncbi:MAG TPA: phage tail protein [Symbiobacteriaceae bacterium]|nr:phage tail protein [Symbiobacteriaceae bacterium]
MGKRWVAIALVAVVTLVFAVSQGQGGKVALAETRSARVQVEVGGRVMSGVLEVSGLGSEVEIVEAVCRADGRDDDCDGVATEVWEANVRKALWTMLAATDEIEAGSSLSGRTRHEVALNAIRNIRARVAQTEEQLSAAVPLKTKHDTVKNSIGNIRAAFRAFGDITVNEEGVRQSAVQDLSEAIKQLEGLGAGYRVRPYRPGRPVYGNITLRTDPGSMDAALLAWYDKGLSGTAERRPVSIVFLNDKGGEAARYNLFECWPVRWSASHLVEEIELAVERVERASK